MTRLGTATDLTTVQAFLNTRSAAGDRDDLVDPSSFGAWLETQGLVADATLVSDGDVVTARALRKALRDLACHDPDLAARAAETLNRLARTLDVSVRFLPDGGVEVAGTAAGAAGALSYLLTTVAAAMTDGSWHRVKLCSDDTCRYAFYDRSRNRSGRWCDMAVCGNRAKARNFRERHQ